MKKIVPDKIMITERFEKLELTCKHEKEAVDPQKIKENWF